ncbi:hypothetical protein ASZ78_004941 [Callipepla squamata]|uniref:DDX60 helicase n=1 Tax=Callipepla squamata TaxID=9009 RepID=A0A226MH18_CALSU|nr:hypothetical protein ASZ78_004941 [Callipepla squamata]
MDSVEDNFWKDVHDSENESADSDKDSECVVSERGNFTAAEEDRVSGSASDSDEEDAASPSTEAAVVQMLKEKEGREEAAEDPGFGETYYTLTSDEAAQQELQSEDRDFRVLLSELDSQNPDVSVYYPIVVLSPRLVSLLKDFVESEFFVIDGDSLLLEFVDEEVQHLTLFYQIERFLHDFTQKGAKYIIVFFKDVEQMYLLYPRCLFLRTALIKHLKHNTCVTIHTEFSSCFSPEWEIFLKKSYPYFIIISDIGLSSLHTDYLTIFIAHSLSKKVNVVLASGQVSDTLRVYGYHLQSLWAHRVFFQMHAHHLRCACEAMVGHREASLYLYEHLELSLKSIQEEVICPPSLLFCFLFSMPELLVISTDGLLSSTSFSTISQQERSKPLSPEVVTDLCRMQCLTTVFLLRMPLSQRAKIRILESCWAKEVLPLIKMQQLCAHFVLKQLSDTDDWKLDLTYLPDLNDDSLLRNLAHYYEMEYSEGLESQKELGKEMDQEYQFLWDTVTKLTQKYDAGGAFPVRNTSQLLLDHQKTSFRGTEVSTEIPDIGLIPLKSDLVEEYAGDVLEDLPVLQSDDPTITSLTKYKEFDELRHWHSGRPLTEEYERVRCNADAKSKDAYDRKQIQKYQTFLRLYGNTLESGASKFIVHQKDDPGHTDTAVRKSKQTHKSKAEVIAEENSRRLRAKEEKKEQEQWKALQVLMEKEIKANLTTGMNKLDKYLKTVKSKSVKFSVEMYGLSACMKAWKQHCRNQGTVAKCLLGALSSSVKFLGCPAGFQTNLIFNTILQMREGSDDKSRSRYDVGIGSSRFQLQCMDYYLLREERNDPDPRVQHFIPDTWQRELLDAVDNNESAVIVAPTSSGKTYASYYCMEKVLRTSDEGVVVYVAPTKALVNQVMGSVYSRFTKKLPDGLVVCGVFTRDYRQDVMNSQILVTVPQCLEILMLSPRCQNWTKRIQYVIFDEVVLYEERYNDLEKYVCSLKGSDFVFDHFHPCASLTVNHIENYGFPSDLSLSPRESVQLYDTMVKAWRKWPRAQEMDPEEFVSLKDKIVIKKMDARKYERELKEELCNWIAAGQRQKVNEVLEILKPHPVDCSENKKWREFACFVDKLHEMDKLPAIFFIFGLDSVERAARNVFLNLLEKQDNERDPKMVREKEVIKSKLRKVNKALMKFESLDVETVRPSKQESLVMLLNTKIQLQRRLEKLTAIPSTCTYANPKAVDEDTLGNIFYRLRFQRRGHWHQVLARRGIGYHHGSMPMRERQTVEMLFRLGYIKVVTATSTLALGINMPCKSVVFAEDSVFLDALNYRQMSGRAGRRGQDMIGNVFFYDIPLPKVERLIKSNVPELKGQFPLTISLILRLMLLAAKADDKMDARAKALSVLKHSLMSFKKERYAGLLKIYFMFSLQFLIKEGYLDQEGNPIGFAGLVTHLHYHEPSNFVLVSFLVKGLFHKLCQPIKEGSTDFSEDVLEKLVLILANLFGRRYLPACSNAFQRKFYQSKTFLEDLPEDFADAVNEYNAKVEENFAHFLLTTAKLADMEEEYRLPLSRTDFTSEEWHGSELASHLIDHTKRTSAVSPFACLSGVVDDDLFHWENVNEAVLRSLGINVTNCPLLCLKKYDNQRRNMPLNAYALDFYKHGSLSALTTDNWLNEGDAYYLLKDFVLLIQSIKTSLSELCDDPNDNVLLAFQKLEEIYTSKLNAVQ